jgi:hypothetical protein
MLAKLRPLVITACFVFIAAVCHTQQPLDNAAVLKMHTAGLSDAVIAQTIAASPGHYDTGVDAMIALKNAGVGDSVIGAMVTKNSGGGAPLVAAASGGPILPAGVDEIGVYYKEKTGTWVEFKPEIVNFKTGGFLKTLATDGIVKGDINGHVPGKSADLKLTRSTEILLYTPEGTAPNEYQLLKLRQNSDNREFRSTTGGVIHASGGAQRDRQDFNPSKIGTRLYTFTIPMELQPGEYGILPPGSVTSTNMASGGKIDTFTLLE